MGACCTSRNKDEHGDLPRPILDDKTPIQKFTLSLPFACTRLGTFVKNLRAAENISGEPGYVTIEAMTQTFTTDAWAGLKDPESPIVQFLLDAEFQSEEKISVSFLICWALLYCPAWNISNRATELFSILQEPPTEDGSER